MNPNHLIKMAKLDKIRGRHIPREFLVDFCENGMENHTKQMYEALFNADWEVLKDISMDYERDCYNIGAIEIVGKLIKLRLLLQDEPVEQVIIERTLNSIAEQSAKVQEFLINHLQSTDSAVVFHTIHYISKPSDSVNSSRHTWYYQ
jgi:hypothetical protein